MNLVRDILVIQLLVSVLIIEISIISGEEIVSVDTNNGPINGQKKVVSGKVVNEFLGIPYAEPPIGDLRFKKPVPVNNWTTPLNATQLPNPCYQINFTDTFLNAKFSEDCLYLNIWQPIVSSDDQNKLKAVMFFIHGGAFIQGSSSEYLYPGEILSTKGDVVLVSHNYRLSTLGFFYTGTDDAPGNAGLWDNVLALKWVRDNIRYFGGDPNRITLFGQSAGSYAISMHILSPTSRNLYQNAVLMSGALISADIATETIAKQQWLTGAKRIRCANDTDNSFNARIISCLQNASSIALAMIPLLPEFFGKKLGILPMVVIDGVFLPKSPVEMFESGNYRKNLSILFGSVEDEGQSATSIFVPGYGAKSPGNYTHEQSIRNLTNMVSRLPSYTTINGEHVSRLYYAKISPKFADYDLLRRTAAIAIGDYYITCRAKVFAETVFNYDRENSNVYQYYYTSKLGTSAYFCTPWMGACHGADLTPVFGLPFVRNNDYTDAQRNESEQMIEIFSHFAKYGYPSPQNGIEWPKFYSLNDSIVTPYLHIDTNAWNFDYGLKITECEYLWKKHIYVKLATNVWGITFNV